MLKLSNKNKYSIQRLCYLCFGVFHFIISLFILKNKNVIILNSTLNNEFSDNSCVLFGELYKLNKKVFFVINNKKKRDELNEIYPGCFIGNRRFRDKLIILKAGVWFCSTLEMPISGYFYRWQRKVIHMGHGMPYKKAGLLEKKATWYKKLYYKLVTTNISYTLAETEFFKPIIASIFGLKEDRVKLLPQPRRAVDQEDESSILGFNVEAFNILYAPTWRHYGSVKLFPFDDADLISLNEFLIKNNIFIWLRVHPQFEQHLDSNLLQLSNVKLFSGKDYPVLNSYMSLFDTLITDYSSLYFDFLMYSKPILFFDYDIELYKKEVGLIDRYLDIKVGNSITTQTQLIHTLYKIINTDYSISEIVRINKLVNYPIKQDKLIDVFIKNTLG